MTSFKPVGILQVALRHDTKSPPVPMGRLAWSRDRRAAVFEYDAPFLRTGMDLSPFQLPLTSESRVSPTRPFDGMFGLFADSLPDGWGRRITDRRLIHSGVDPRNLNPVDRLALIGSSGMGALTYEPDRSFGEMPGGLDLDALYRDMARADRDDDIVDFDRLERLNGGSAGARPKAMVHIDASGCLMTTPADDRQAWLVKFAARNDPPDFGAVEAAYAEMARRSGLRISETKFLPSRTKNSGCAGYFATKRFDRQGARRILTHTVAGLLHADHTMPSITYETLLNVTRKITKDQDSVEEQFRRAVFNVVSGNRDDHTKNHAFCFDITARRYQVSPAYDLTPSSGAGGEHACTINHKGKNIGRDDLLVLARHGSIPHERACSIIDEVTNAVRQWPAIADEYGMSRITQKTISAMIDPCLKPFGNSINMPEIVHAKTASHMQAQRKWPDGSPQGRSVKTRGHSRRKPGSPEIDE